MVTGDDGSSDLSGSDLGHVENDGSGDESNTETRDQSTSNNLISAKNQSLEKGVTYKTKTFSGSGLENVSDNENSTSRDNGPSSTNVIGHITSNQSTKEGTSGKDGGDEGFLPSGKSELFSGNLGGVETGVEGDKVPHSEDTVHVSRVVSDISMYLKDKGGGTHPKKIPPNEAKTHSKYALSVTGASTLSASDVPASAWGTSTLSASDGPTASFTVDVSNGHGRVIDKRVTHSLLLLM